MHRLLAAAVLAVLVGSSCAYADGSEVRNAWYDDAGRFHTETYFRDLGPVGGDRVNEVDADAITTPNPCGAGKFAILAGRNAGEAKCVGSHE